MHSLVKNLQMLVNGMNEPHYWSTVCSLQHYPPMQNSLQRCADFLPILQQDRCNP